MSPNRFTLLVGVYVFITISCAQQPTPFIPAHTGPATVTTTLLTSSVPSSTITDNSASSHLRDFYPTYDRTIRIPTLRDASAILQALTSVQSTWTAGADYRSITAAVYEAAPTSAQLSLSQSGYSWDKIVQAPWYTAIPTHYQSLISQQEDALQGVFNNLSESSIANPGSISSGSRVSIRSRDGSELLGGVAGVVFGMMLGVAMGIL